jgi:hypothetical protein
VSSTTAFGSSEQQANSMYGSGEGRLARLNRG